MHEIRNEQTFLWKIIFGRRFPGNPAPFKKIKRKHIRKPPIRYRRYHENGCGTLFHFFVNPKWGAETPISVDFGECDVVQERRRNTGKL